MPFAVTNQTIGAAGTLEDSFVAPTASRPNDFTPLNPSVVNVVNVAIAPPAPTTGTLATTIEYAQGIVSESVAEYGVQETPVVITLLETLEDAALLAEYLIRSAPAFWFGNIQIIMNGLTDAQRTTINSLDIGSQVSVTKSFPNSTPSTVTQLMALEGISHDITPDRHIVTLYPNPARIYTYFIVGGYATTTTRTNLVFNPNFETDILFSAASGNNGIARSTTQSYLGSASLAGTKVIDTGNATFGTQRSANRIPVTGGQTYTGSFYVKSASISRSAQARIEFRDAGGSIIQTSNGTASATSTTEWGRRFVTITAPALAVSAVLDVLLANVPPSETHYIDALLLETGSTLLPYFDGRYADTYTGYTLESQSWSGTADGSTSTATWGLTSSLFGSQLDDDTKGLG
jgi:hypothetical protein